VNRWKQTSAPRILNEFSDHVEAIIGEPAVSPANNAAEMRFLSRWFSENSLERRNDRGMFAYETLLSLLATCHQQRCNPYNEFKQTVRNSETILRDQAVRAVASSVNTYYCSA
jgi:hypothetical protein